MGLIFMNMSSSQIINHFFQLFQQNKSSATQVNFRKANKCLKSVLEAINLAYANNIKESMTS